MSKTRQTIPGLQGSLWHQLASGLRICMIPLKILWLAWWLLFATLLVTLPILVSSVGSTNGYFAFQMSRIWATIILTITGVRVNITGTEKIIRKQSYVIISNHQSHFDGPAIAKALGIQFRWVAKKELLKIPIFGHCLAACGNIFIDRSNREKALTSIKEGIARLPEGVGVFFFAEGTRSANGRLGRFKKGGFLAAIQSGCPILPVTVNGSHKVLSKRSIVFYSHPIEIIVGDPIDVRTFTLDQVEDLMEQTRTVIASNQHF